MFCCPHRSIEANAAEGQWCADHFPLCRGQLEDGLLLEEPLEFLLLVGQDLAPGRSWECRRSAGLGSNTGLDLLHNNDGPGGDLVEVELHSGGQEVKVSEDRGVADLWGLEEARGPEESELWKSGQHREQLLTVGGEE